MAMFRISRPSGLVLGLLITLIVGCSGSTTHQYQGPTGQLSGKVTFKKKPVTTGRVVLVSGRASVAGKVQEDGTFSLTYQGSTNIPVGKYKVAVQPPRSKPATGEDASATVKSAMIPDKYQLPSTSELTVTVKEGENPPLEIDMK